MDAKQERVYHQLLEGVKWLARDTGGTVTEIMDDIFNDIIHGRFERLELDKQHEFWA